MHQLGRRNTQASGFQLFGSTLASQHGARHFVCPSAKFRTLLHQSCGITAIHHQVERAYPAQSISFHVTALLGALTVQRFVLR